MIPNAGTAQSNGQSGSDPRVDLCPSEFRMAFSGFEVWRQWAEQNPWFFQRRHGESIAEELRRRGFWCPVAERDAPPEQLEDTARNYREGFLFQGFTCRLRAVWLELRRALRNIPREDARVYAPEATSAFARRLAMRHPRFVGSEFYPLTWAQRWKGIRREDLARLSFSDETFDAIVINDVFEHLPHLDDALRETQRVLRRGGTLISTFPFNLTQNETLIKARETPAGTAYLAPPEYHGDPVSPEGCLVYQIPGWDILDRMREAGWTRVEMILRVSAAHGIIANGFPGVFVLVCVR